MPLLKDHDVPLDSNKHYSKDSRAILDPRTIGLKAQGRRCLCQYIPATCGFLRISTLQERFPKNSRKEISVAMKVYCEDTMLNETIY